MRLFILYYLVRDYVGAGNLRGHEKSASDVPRMLQSNDSTENKSYLFPMFMVFVCLASASIACGLTQGLLSLNPLELNVKIRSGTAVDRERASRVLPLITNHHLLLVTLMLFNATANEALPLFLDQLVPPFIVIIMSVSLVLLFGEIIPSAFFTGPNQLQIASFLAPFTWFVIFVLYPIAYPLAKVLDAWLGHDDGMTMFNRKEIYTMMQIQQEEAPKRGVAEHNAVVNDEVAMIGGALNLRDRTVDEVMTKDVFMLSINEKLTLKTLWKIFHSGCSRVPIYELDRNDIVGLIIVKDLLFVDADDELPIRNFMTIFGRPIISVWPDDKLSDVFRLLRSSHIHMAIVRDVNNNGESDPFYELKGIITMEDIFEAIIGGEIMDETEEDNDIYAKLKGFDPNVDFTRLKHAKSISEKPTDLTSLTEDEIKAVVSYLNSEVPNIAMLLGKDNIEEITKLVKDSKVIYIEDRKDSQRASLNSDEPLLDLTDLGDECTDQATSHAKEDRHEYLYKRGKVSNVCTLILSGALTVLAGKDEFKVEKGPWSTLGADILLEEDGAYISDFSAYISSSQFRCLRIFKPSNKSKQSVKRKSNGKPTVHSDIKPQNESKYEQSHYKPLDKHQPPTHRLVPAIMTRSIEKNLYDNNPQSPNMSLHKKTVHNPEHAANVSGTVSNPMHQKTDLSKNSKK